MKKIFIGLDETLVGTMQVWLDLINQINNTSYTLQDIKQYDQDILINNSELLKKNLYKMTEPFEGAVEFIKKLQKDFRVIIITHDYLPELKRFKNRFVQKYFGGIVVKHTTLGKHEVVGNNILIDDRFHTIYNHIKQNNSLGILFNFNNQYYYNDYRFNNKNFKRCSSYEEILKEIYEY